MIWIILYIVIWILTAAATTVIQNNFGPGEYSPKYITPGQMLGIWLIWPVVLIWLVGYIGTKHLVHYIERRK
jgi:uncharacterized membrane protein